MSFVDILQRRAAGPGDAFVFYEDGERESAHVLFPTQGEADALGEAGLAHRYGVQFHWRNAGYTTFEDYLGRFSSKRRNQIRRERREMDKAGIALTTERGRITPEVIDVMYGFYLATVEKFSWGRQYLNRLRYLPSR